MVRHDQMMAMLVMGTKRLKLINIYNHDQPTWLNDDELIGAW